MEKTDEPPGLNIYVIDKVVSKLKLKIFQVVASIPSTLSVNNLLWSDLYATISAFF